MKGITGFIKDRVNLLQSIDNINMKDVKDFCNKYNIPIPSVDEVILIGLHKARVNSIDSGITDDMKNKSREWLRKKGYSEEL